MSVSMIRHKSHNKPDINHSPYFISYMVGEPDKDFFFSTDGTPTAGSASTIVTVFLTISHVRYLIIRASLVLGRVEVNMNKIQSQKDRQRMLCSVKSAQSQLLVLLY